MAKVRFHPLFEHLRGTIKGMVFRLSHNGKISAYLSPDMSQVTGARPRMPTASRWQKHLRTPRMPSRIPDHPGNLRANGVGDIRKTRIVPYDMAVSDYYHNHNNLLGDKFQWDVQLYRWKMENRKERKRKKRR